MSDWRSNAPVPVARCEPHGCVKPCLACEFPNQPQREMGAAVAAGPPIFDEKAVTAPDRIPIEFGMGDPKCYDQLVGIIRDLAKLPRTAPDERVDDLIARARAACGMRPWSAKK